jgi:chromosome condensin MukBEF ATPase and DNA-binding subunit MukB
MKNLRLFSSFCGQMAMPHVKFVTTMWCYVPEELGTRRQEELKGEVWREMLDDGCSVQRFENTYQSAWRIIGKLRNHDRAQILLPDKIVGTRLQLNRTTAGVTLNGELEKLIKDQNDTARRIEEQAGTQGNELMVQLLNEQKAEIEEKIHEIADQLREIKIPFTRRVRLFFKGRRG